MSYSPFDSDSNATVSLLCNADPSVVALLQPLPAQATQSEISLRNALLKLQQATLRGRSTYAAKLLEMSLQDVQQDKQMHELLVAYMRELEQRQNRVDAKNETDASHAEDEDDRPSKATTTLGPVPNDDNYNDQEQTDTAQVTRLKDQVRQEQNRANTLQKQVITLLRQEIQSLQQEQTSIRERQAAWQKRIQSLQCTIQSLPDSSEETQDLQNDLADLQTYQLFAGSSTTSYDCCCCTVCQDAPAVRAVIPCGHLCLCDTCTKALAESDETTMRQCPLCRGHLLSTLHIYTTK